MNTVPHKASDGFESCADTLEFFTAKSGALSARAMAGNRVRHIHSAIDPESEAGYFGDLVFWGNVIVLLGTGLGYHLQKKIPTLPSQAVLVLVDSFAPCIGHCKSTILSGLPNRIISATPDKLKAKREELKALGHKGAIQFVKHPASYHVNPEFFQDVKNAILASNRPKSSKPPRVLLLHGSFFLEEELRRALEQSAAPASVFAYKGQRSLIEFEDNFLRAMQDFRPDMILSVNMNGFDGEGILAQTASAMGVPISIWFVDDPHPILIHRRDQVNSSMMAFSWERGYCDSLTNAGFGSVSHLPLAGDAAMMTTEKKPAKIDLGFVGSSMGRAFLEEKILRNFVWNPALEPVVQKAAKRLLENPSLSVIEILKSEIVLTGLTIPKDNAGLAWLCSYVIHSASCEKRRALVCGLLPLGIQTFGDPEGWRDVAGQSLIVNPDVDYRTGVGRIYAQTAVNLNITSCQMPSAVNQRVFDVPLAGGFVLSDNQPDLAALFELGTEAVCYTSLADCREKVSFYLRRPDARLRITQAARKRIEGEHLYLHRVRKILGG